MLIAVVVTLSAMPLARSEEKECSAYLSHEVRKLRSAESITLCDAFRGNAMLIVNTAARCGFTPRFAGLEALHQRYRVRGLAVLGVPSNDFRQAAPDEESAAKVWRKRGTFRVRKCLIFGMPASLTV
jgi:glutathione peroxidase